MSKRLGGRPPIYGVPMAKRVCMSCPVHLLRVVDEVAASRGVSRSRVFRDALTLYVEQRSLPQ